MPASKTLAEFLKKHPSPLIVVDPASKAIININLQATRILGYTAAQARKLTLFNILETDGGKIDRQTASAFAVTRAGSRIPVTVHRRLLPFGRKKSLVLFIDAPANGADSDADFFETALTIINQGIIVFSDSLEICFANSTAARNVGYSAEHMRGILISELFKFPDEMGLRALMNSLRRNESESINLQLKFTRKDGSQYNAGANIRVLDEHRFLMIANDITQKLVGERRLMDALREKEALIKEIHHRVKNNLQLISSIIYLKLASIDHVDIRDFLEDVREKIRSIALIHERLLQSENIHKVEIADYLGKLVHDIESTWMPSDLSLRIETSFDKSLLHLDNAIMCGLIVNELMTNSIKHAFKGRRDGVITVVFREHKGSFLLSVSDDGISLPGDISPGQGVSFGMQLIDVFVRQLGGRLVVLREQGTNFQIHF